MNSMDAWGKLGQRNRAGGWGIVNGLRGGCSPLSWMIGILLAGVGTILTATAAPGDLKWTFQAGGAVVDCPAIGVDGMVFVGSANGKVYARLRDELLAGGRSGWHGLYRFLRWRS